MIGSAEVVITGAGVVAPGASSPAELAAVLHRAEPRVERLAIASEDLPLYGCSVIDGPWLDAFSTAERRRLDRISLLGLAAAQQAINASGLDMTALRGERFGVVVGVGFGGIQTLTSEHQVMLERGWRRLSPFGVVATMPSSLAAVVSIRFAAKGPTVTVSSACASGTQALIDGARMIRDGSAEVVLAGGAEAPLDILPMAAFTRMDAMAAEREGRPPACRPFDRRRTGFVLGEGAGFVVLMAAETARAEGLPVLARLSGWGVTADAVHVTAPDSEGGGPERSIRLAIERARVPPSEIGHVNAHGTGTRLNDLVEARALSNVFGDFAVPVTANKAVIGHLMGGAGAVEAIATLEAMSSGSVPPTACSEEPDMELPLDVIRAAGRAIPVRSALSCSFGFGGQNASLVLSPPGPSAG